MLAKLKAIHDGIIIAGDGRHDSTGHSAKFGAYTIFCCTVPMIIHFSLVQVTYIFYHYYFWVMHLQCSSLQCHLGILYTLYRVHNLCTLLFYSQMHFFNLLIDLTNNLIFIGDIKLVFPFYLYPSFFLERNKAGNSTGMEFMAFQHCMDFLLAYGLLIATFISDRHTTIASHMKNVPTTIVHYFDIWHLKKSKDIPVFTIIVDCIIFL